MKNSKQKNKINILGQDTLIEISYTAWLINTNWFCGRLYLFLFPPGSVSVMGWVCEGLSPWDVEVFEGLTLQGEDSVRAQGCEGLILWLLVSLKVKVYEGLSLFCEVQCQLGARVCFSNAYVSYWKCWRNIGGYAQERTYILCELEQVAKMGTSWIQNKWPNLWTKCKMKLDSFLHFEA